MSLALIFRFSDEHVFFISLHSGGAHFTPLLAVGLVLCNVVTVNTLSLSLSFGTYGAFGKATHKLIASATANTPRPVFSPPKQHAYLLFGFCLARANARMLINAASKRSSAKNAVRASRPRSTSPVAVNG